jgi:hypothetical protein
MYLDNTKFGDMAARKNTGLDITFYYTDQILDGVAEEVWCGEPHILVGVAVACVAALRALFEKEVPACEAQRAPCLARLPFVVAVAAYVAVHALLVAHHLLVAENWAPCDGLCLEQTMERPSKLKELLQK